MSGTAQVKDGKVRVAFEQGVSELTKDEALTLAAAISDAAKTLPDPIRPGFIYEGSDGNLYLATDYHGEVRAWRLERIQGATHQTADYWLKRHGVTLTPLKSYFSHVGSVIS